MADTPASEEEVETAQSGAGGGGAPAPVAKGGESFFSTVYPRVFIPAFVLVIGFVLYGFFAEESVADATVWLRENVIGTLGWYYVAIVSAFVIFALVVGISRLGDIKLGKDDEKPEFSIGVWLAMLFSAGMGIGLVFYGVAEPLYHFAGEQPWLGGGQAEAGGAAMTQTLLHWGIHAWAIYVVAGLAIAYAVHRRGRPISIRWTLEPLLGDRVKGWLGDVIDVIAILGTVFGVATSLGLGATQIAGGFSFLEWVDPLDPDNPNNALLLGIIAVITFIAAFSVVTGLKKGIKWLSQLNVSIAGLLALFVLIAGPTLFILREFVESIGRYLQNLLVMSFDVTTFHGDVGTDWQVFWTIFYWGWWISWAPFVGMFIARISKGRTVREFVIGVLGVPTLVTIGWFAIMGGSALEREQFGDGGLIGEDGSIADSQALFQLLDGFPLGTVTVIVAIVLIATFFITSSDSGSLVVDMLASGGDPNPPTWSRVFWATTEGGVAAVLLLAGVGTVSALQVGAVMLGLPFSLVMIGMAVATWKGLRSEHLQFIEVDQARRQEVLAARVTESVGESLGTAVAEEAPPIGDATPQQEQAWNSWWDRVLARLKSRPGSPME